MKQAELIRVWALAQDGDPGVTHEMAKMVANRTLGAAFISHKHIPDSYEGYYGAMSFVDQTLLLLPTNPEDPLVVVFREGGEIKELPRRTKLDKGRIDAERTGSSREP